MAESNPFWAFSLAVYRQPGVEDACLEAQQGVGADVNMLLYCAWRASHGIAVEAEEIAGLESTVSDWRREVVQPIRALRQRLRGYPGAEAVRDQLQRAELVAEEQQQRRMVQRAAPLAGVDGGNLLRANLQVYADLEGMPMAGLEAFEVALLRALRSGIADPPAR